MEIAILGAGISGISTAYHLRSSNHTVSLYEARNTWGGLLDNFKPRPGFTFDHFIHLSFTSNEYVKKIFDKSTDSVIHNPISYNLSDGVWMKHPVQFNLAPLPVEEKVKIIESFMTRSETVDVKNYRDWLYRQYGAYFSDNYPGKYTKKYWSVEPEQLTTNWVSSRFTVPDLSQILRGAFETQEENFYYAKSMRYPTKGGYKAYLGYMASSIDIQTGKKAILLDLEKKRIDFHDGTHAYFDKLVTTIPLPELVRIIKDLPTRILEAAEKLSATSGQLVSIGFNKVIPQHLWYYIYDEDFYPARAYSPSVKSSGNVPEGKSSVQFETYFSKYRAPYLSGDDLIDHIVKKSNQFGTFAPEDIEFTDYREVKYANVLFDFNREQNLEIVHEYLDKSSIEYCGRFGMWEYLWSDQCLISGKNMAEKIFNE